LTFEDRGNLGGGFVRSGFGRALGLAGLAAVAAVSTAAGEDEFPIVGTYARDQECVGEIARRLDLLVKITRTNIESNQGSCRILTSKRNGQALSVQVQCKVTGDQLILGDVTFTIRDEKTVEFEDQDHTSDATLYKCGEQTATPASR
jgi:hypothetical protein